MGQFVSILGDKLGFGAILQEAEAIATCGEAVTSYKCDGLKYLVNTQPLFLPVKAKLILCEPLLLFRGLGSLHSHHKYSVRKIITRIVT